MPYDSITDLPETIQSILPTKAQEIFMAAFNSAWDSSCDERQDKEQCANAIAWGAVKRSYEKNDAGEWVEMKQKQHDAILQSLNREIGGYCFRKEAFEETINEWNGIPLVFANEHPDMALFADNPEEALSQINGRVVGMVENPYIAYDGHPRMMGTLVNNDSEVDKLITDGKASISTGFLASTYDHNIVESVIPNHVLIFKEDINNMPKDHGAFILNKHEFYGQVIDTEVHNMEPDIKELSKDLAIANKELGDMTSKLDIANKEIDGLKASVTERDGQLEVANKTISDYELKIKEFEQKEAEALVIKRDEQWTTIKNSIPKGLTHKAEDEQALRAEWESDPFAFTAKIAEIKIANKTAPSGNEFVPGGEEEDGIAQMRELNKALGKV
jgi:cation transport regulator